jgi:sugar phosphate isomerase/epimerase
VGLAGLDAFAIHAYARAGRFTLGACDWSLGQRARTDALTVAKQLGLDGVQVSMGSVDNDLQLRRADVQRAYRDAATATGVRIGGVALDLMNQVPYKSDPRTEQWVSARRPRDPPRLFRKG